MKDITKGDILVALEDLPALIKKDKRSIAQMMLPSVQQYVHGAGEVYWETRNKKLQVSLKVRRTNAQVKKALKEER